jgi:hypothetical protein
MMLDAINQITQQKQRDEKDFGTRINELIMRQTKAKQHLEPNVWNNVHVNSTTSHKAHVEDPKR